MNEKNGFTLVEVLVVLVVIVAATTMIIKYGGAANKSVAGIESLYECAADANTSSDCLKLAESLNKSK
jgi:prepilin-type N-terminal cleavage/methylation domain-containing protein